MSIGVWFPSYRGTGPFASFFFLNFGFSIILSHGPVEDERRKEVSCLGGRSRAAARVERVEAY